MMQLTEISEAAGVLSRLLSTGETLANATEEMAQMQPKRADFWTSASAANRNGRPLSESLALVWPAPIVSTVRAGEEAGRLEAILNSIRDTCELQIRLRSSARKILRPLLILVVAMLVGITFMAVLVPKIVRTITASAGGRIEHDALTRLAFAMEAAWKDHGLVLAVILVVSVVSAVRWFRSPAAADTIMRTMLAVPVLGPGVRDVSFGLWANYLALSVGAGLPVVDGLRITAPVLPAALRGGVDVMHHDLAVRNHSLSRAASSDGIEGDDPRKLWPRYVVNAFRAGERTGRIDREFALVSPALVDLGERQINRFLGVADTVSIALAAFFAGLPLLLIYQPIFRIIGTLN